MNALYHGDHMHVLRDLITDESDAQITAFEDSWHWDEQAEREFDEIIHGKNTDLALKAIIV